MKEKLPSVTEPSGFTLLEVMIAMAVLSIGIMAIAGIQYMIVNGNTNGNVVTQEMMLAQRVMEQVKNTDDPVTIFFAPLAGVDQTSTLAGPYNVNVTALNPLGGNTSRFITVSVTKVGGVGGHPVILQCLTHGKGI